ncbi:MAG: translocation/assembly module TamB domain-containing protein [Acidobacteriota bacterium]
MPKAVHWLIYTTGVLLVLFAVAIAVASTGWFRQILENQIEANLSQVTGGKVEIEGMGFRPLELRVSARRLIIHGLEKPSRQPLFSAQDVVVNVSPESLLKFRLVLQTLQWQRADVHIWTYDDGSTNLPQTSVTPGQGESLADLLDLGIERVTLSNTTLNWNNRRIPIQFGARNVVIQLHVSQDRHYQGGIAASGATFTWKSRTSPRLSFATTFRLSSEQLQVTAFSWQIGNLRGKLLGSLHWMPQLAGNFEYRINGGLQQFARALKIAPLESGYLYLDGKGTYGEKGFTVKGRMQARDLMLSVPQFTPGALNFATTYDFARSQLRLTTFTFTGLRARAEGDAAVSLGKGAPRVRLRSRFTNLSLTALMQAIPESAHTIGILNPQADVDGAVSATWQSPSRLKSQFDLQFRRPAEPATSGLPVSGHAQGSVELGREVLLSFKDAQISTPRSTMEAQGTFGTTQSSLAIKFVTSDFEEWRPVAKALIETRNPLPITLRSQAVFTGKVSGTFASPEIDGRATTGSFLYAGWVWDSFQAGLLVSPHRARIESGRVKLGASSLTMDAEARLVNWKLEPDSAVRLHATARETPLAGLRAALDLKPSMKGLLTGRVEAEGTVRDLSGHGHLEVQKGEFAGLPFDSLSANVAATKSAWEVSDIRLAEGRGRASGRMTIDPIQHTFSADLQGRDFPLDQIRFLERHQAETKSKAEISGLVSFKLQGQGTFDNARVHSTLDATQLAWRGQSLGSVHGEAEWQGQQIKLQVKGGGGEAGSFQVTGNMETRNNWPLHVSGEYTDFRADPWIEEFSSHAMGAKIAASGSFVMNGPLREPSQLEGSSRIEALEISIPSFKLTNEGPVEVSYAKRNVRFKQFRLQGPSTNFEAGGSIHLGTPPSLDLSVKGEAAASLLSLVSSEIQATGESKLEVRLTGTPANPQLSGSVEVKDVGLGYKSLPIRLGAMNGTIKLQGERAVISSLKGNVGGGAVNLTGFFSLRETHRYRLQTNLSQVRIRYPTDFTSVLDGKLTLAGTPAEGQLSGEISVRNLFANENLNLVDLISGPGNLLGGPSVSASSPLTSGISLNVHLASIRPVRIETRNLRLVSEVDLHMQGTLANPVAVGTIYLRSGSAIFRGNRYTLTRGDISMTNPFQTEPVLDLQVNTRVDKYDLTLEVSGPPDKVQFSYRSDPPLPTEDILSLLAFGYSKRLEEFAPSPSNPFSSASASALLSTALSSPVSGRIQRLFGVSRIKFAPTSGQVGTLGGPVLTVEQQLSPQLTLTYQTSTANSLDRVVEFEWVVSPRLSVRGFRDQNGIIGMELKFRKRFK